MRLYAPLHPESIAAIKARSESRKEFWAMVIDCAIVAAISAAMLLHLTA